MADCNGPKHFQRLLLAGVVWQSILLHASFVCAKALVDFKRWKQVNSICRLMTRRVFSVLRTTSDGALLVVWPWLQLTFFRSGSSKDSSCHRQHVHHFWVDDSPSCPASWRIRENPKHAVLHCPRFTMERENIWTKCWKRVCVGKFSYWGQRRNGLWSLPQL